MGLSNTVCRDIMNTQDVIKNQLINLLVGELVTDAKLDHSACEDLAKKVSRCVDEQTNSLIDRVLNEFAK